MHAYVRHGGVKKFRQLILIHSYHAVLGIEGYGRFAVCSVKNDNILPIIIHDQSSSTVFSSSKELVSRARISALISASRRNTLIEPYDSIRMSIVNRL